LGSRALVVIIGVTVYLLLLAFVQAGLFFRR